MNQTVQNAKLLKYFTSYQILITILRGDNNPSESTCKHTKIYQSNDLLCNYLIVNAKNNQRDVRFLSRLPCLLHIIDRFRYSTNHYYLFTLPFSILTLDTIECFNIGFISQLLKHGVNELKFIHLNRNRKIKRIKTPKSSKQPYFGVSSNRCYFSQPTQMNTLVQKVYNYVIFIAKIKWLTAISAMCFGTMTATTATVGYDFLRCDVSTQSYSDSTCNTTLPNWQPPMNVRFIYQYILWMH